MISRLQKGKKVFKGRIVNVEECWYEHSMEPYYLVVVILDEKPKSLKFDEVEVNQK